MSASSSGRRVGPYDILHSKPIYENAWIKLREDRVSWRGGPEQVFGVVAMRPGVSVLPLEEDGSVYLVREFKYAMGEESLEVISGAMESGEKPEHTGLRELAEECGLIAAEWVDMGVVNPFTTIIASPNHMFLARKLSKVGRGPGAGDEVSEHRPGERVSVVRMPYEDALLAVLRGQITHGASCVLILKTREYLEKQGTKR
jgi:ADP-ribose pyrophosphatase